MRRPGGLYARRVPRPGNVASNAAITSASQAATMVSGGVLALVVAATIGTNAETDGFFAAFAAYATVVAFAQSVRTTVVARMLEGTGRFTAFDQFLGAGLLLFAVVAVAFGPLGDPIAGLLTGSLPPAARDTAATALLLFVPASGLQIFAAFGAAMLGALEDFLWAGVAFVAGSVLSIGAFVALQPSLGVDGLAVAILIGSVLSAAIVAIGLLREGWRPSRTSVSEPRAAGRAAGVLLISSVSFLIAQFGFLVTLGIGARLGVGVITVYTYSYLAMGLVQAVFVSSVPMVMAGPLSLTWDRRPATLLPHHEAVVRAGMLLLVPVLAAAALVGTDVAGFVLREFSDSQSTLVIELFLVLSVNVIWGLVNTVPYAALVGVGRYTALAVVTAGVVAIQIAIAFAAGAADSVWLLAAAVPISTAATVVTTLFIVSRGYALLAAPRLTAIVMRFLATGAIAYGAPYAAAQALGIPAAAWLALAAGSALYGYLVTIRPAEREIATRLVAALPRPGMRAATHR
jgi:peptidoglycan biosynthesis protein MviN/MurJ (putative lipid II flippase)